MQFGIRKVKVKVFRPAIPAGNLDPVDVAKRAVRGDEDRCRLYLETLPSGINRF